MAVDWDAISSQPNGVLTDRFISKFNSSINFDILIGNYVLSTYLITTFFNRINFKKLIKTQSVDELVLKKYNTCFDNTTWQVLFHLQNLSDSFKEEFKEQMISKPKSSLCYDIKSNNSFVKFTKLHIEEFNGTCFEKIRDNSFRRVDLHKIDWVPFIRTANFRETELRKIQHFFDAATWTIIPKYRHLSEKFKVDFNKQLNQYDGKLLSKCYPNAANKIKAQIFIVVCFYHFLYSYN